MDEISKRFKFLILIENNLVGLIPYLNEIGYNAVEVPKFLIYPKKERDFQIHLWINKRNKIKAKPIIFVTNDGNYFQETRFNGRRYAIFWIRKQENLQKIANKIMNELTSQKRDINDNSVTTL